MAGASRTFRPPLWATIGLVAMTSVCIAAGLWQMDRAEQKRQLFDSFESGESDAARIGLVADEEAEQFRYGRFVVSGRYDGAHQVLLDNMLHNGQTGYQVLTPLQVGDEAVLINRGWVPADPDRDMLPVIRVDNDLRAVAGRLSPLPRPGMRLDASRPLDAASWPRRLLYPRVGEIIGQLGYALRDYQLLLDPDQPDGYVRSWRPALMSPENHIGYAIQWFAMALAVFVIYVVVNLKRAAGKNDCG